jgi:translocation and assembly module TamB
VSRAKHIALWVSGGLLGLLLVVFLAGIAIVRTDWFRNMVREKIIAAVETGTGGRAEIGSFTFDWTHLRAQIRNFVVHGLEPADAAPLVRADLLQVDLKLLSPFRGFVDIAYVLVQKPQANVIVYADGHTNVPSPKVPGNGDKTALQTVVDLALGKFDLRDGTVKFAERTSELNLSGENLRTELGFNMVTSRYTGEVDVSPLYVNGLRVDVKLPVTLEKDRISLTNALLHTPKSQVTLTGTMEHLIAPRTSAHVVARVAIDEVKQMAAIGIPLDTAHAPAVINADVTASLDDAGLKVQKATANLGQTNLAVSGTTKQLQFQTTLALGELGESVLRRGQAGGHGATRWQRVVHERERLPRYRQPGRAQRRIPPGEYAHRGGQLGFQRHRRPHADRTRRDALGRARRKSHRLGVAGKPRPVPDFR